MFSIPGSTLPQPQSHPDLERRNGQRQGTLQCDLGYICFPAVPALVGVGGRGALSRSCVGHDGWVDEEGEGRKCFYKSGWKCFRA